MARPRNGRLKLLPRYPIPHPLLLLKLPSLGRAKHRETQNAHQNHCTTPIAILFAPRKLTLMAMDVLIIYRLFLEPTLG